MILNLPGLVYAITLLVVANHELRARGAKPLTALLSLGLTELDMLWETVEKLITRLNPLDRPRFDKRNPVHRGAALLLMAQMAWSIWQLLLPLGESAPNLYAADLSGVILNLVAAAIIYVALSMLGTGWRLRRDLDSVLRRLGLRLPTLRDWLAGLVMGTLIFGGMTLAASVLPSNTTADQSGAHPLFNIVKSSLPAALLVAILAGTGEEIFFRGALQPVFGLYVSSLLFALSHTHYGLTPEMLILFLVSIGFGLARKRFNTTAAIIAHATYNFAPFLILRFLPV